MLGCSQAVAILDQLTPKKLFIWIGCDSDELSTGATHLLKKIIEAITNLPQIKAEREKYEAKRKADPLAKMRPFPFCWDKIGEL